MFWMKTKRQMLNFLSDQNPTNYNDDAQLPAFLNKYYEQNYAQS